MLLMRAISNASIEILSTKELIRKSLSANACVRIKGDFHLGSRRTATMPVFVAFVHTWLALISAEPQNL